MNSAIFIVNQNHVTMENEEIQSGFETWLQSEKGIDVNSYGSVQ